MTTEEASKILYHEWQAFLEEHIDYGGVSEAYKIAIKALEQAPKSRTARCTGCRFYDDCKREMESEG